MSHLGECNLINCHCDSRIERQYFAALKRLLTDSRYSDECRRLVWGVCQDQLEVFLNSWLKSNPPGLASYLGNILRTEMSKPDKVGTDLGRLWAHMEPKVEKLIEDALVELGGTPEPD